MNLPCASQNALTMTRMAVIKYNKKSVDNLIKTSGSVILLKGIKLRQMKFVEATAFNLNGEYSH